ncbi:hypothetical protein RF55_23195 [Lasius niger]|uniref:Uncharacterized protein n=1 Tax=Lasius niger TaxID=67767 RepID=A0A0J7JW61_LASNI|nr:hypothetical protein RF55_23195 [Lasius niger]
MKAPRFIPCNNSVDETATFLLIPQQMFQGKTHANVFLHRDQDVCHPVRVNLPVPQTIPDNGVHTPNTNSNVGGKCFHCDFSIFSNETVNFRYGNIGDRTVCLPWP